MTVYMARVLVHVNLLPLVYIRSGQSKWVYNFLFNRESFSSLLNSRRSLVLFSHALASPNSQSNADLIVGDVTLTMLSLVDMCWLAEYQGWAEDERCCSSEEEGREVAQARRKTLYHYPFVTFLCVLHNWIPFKLFYPYVH